MSEKNCLPELRNPNLDASMQVRNEDVVAIQVAKAEQMLQEEDLRIETLIDATGKKITEEREALDKLMKTKANASLSAKLKSVIKALKALGSDDIDYSISVSISGMRGEPTVIEGWSLSPYKGGNGLRHTLEPRKLTAGERALIALINKGEDTINALKDELVVVRQKLSQIGTLERRARANMATVILRQSEGGRALLTQLDKTPLLALANETKKK